MRPLSAAVHAPHAVEGTRRTQCVASSSATANDSDADARLVTTLDLDLQHTLERQIARYVARNDTRGVRNAAAILVDTRDMGVKALVGSANFFDRTIDGR